jgi:hypothetical protein
VARVDKGIEMTTITLPPLPCVGDLAFMTPEELRARDLEVARLVLEGAEEVADACTAARIRNIEVKHHE